MAPTPTPDVEAYTRNARHDARTRQLLAAAANLMQRSGSHSISMQSIADEAGISVGLIYRYYANKEELVQAVIVGVLDDMAYLVPRSITQVDDPVRQVVAAFTAYAEVIRDNRRATLLTYRESNQLGPEAQERIKELELQTGAPLRDAILTAVDEGYFRPINAKVFAYNLLMVAHSWALKHWYFSTRMTFEEFVQTQVSLALHTALKAEFHADYADLLAEPQLPA